MLQTKHLAKRLLTLALVCFCVFVVSGESSAWYNNDWPYRKPITIDHTQIDADLTDFPVLIVLTADAELAASAQADGDDILFADAWTYPQSVPDTGGARAVNNRSTGAYGSLTHSLPTAVTLAGFAADPGAGKISLTWETGSEVNLMGFNLYRSTSLAGVYHQLNESLIESQLPGMPVGTFYAWVDRDVEPGVPYYYRLEQLNVNGNPIMFGPESASAEEPYRIYLPLVTQP